jgi:iron complex transport system ATP-binding protein
MAMTGTETFASRQIAELSDGERQRVMIARALAQEPAALVLDEVTAFLDLPRRVEIVLMLRALARETGCALLLSTHDLDLALRTADSLWLLASGGEFSAGTPETLVLNGAFDHVFHSDGLDFDQRTGQFRLHRPHAGRIGLRADGMEGVWTHRALERMGFDVVGADPPDTPSLHVAVDGGLWRLTRLRSVDTYPSLDALLAELSRHASTTPAEM